MAGNPHQRMVFIAVACAVFLLAAAAAARGLTIRMAITFTPEPEECGLCGNDSYHAPCLLKLSTGQRGERQNYDNKSGA